MISLNSNICLYVTPDISLKITPNLAIGIYALRPEGSENITLGFQVSDLCFYNQNDLRNPKMGSKQSVTGPTL